MQDDTVLLLESHTDLQNQLDVLAEYFETWKLKVNVKKSKVMIFTKGRLPQNTVLKYNNILLETVNEFTYLGVLMSRTGSFSKTKKKFKLTKPQLLCMTLSKRVDCITYRSNVS